MAVLCDVRRRRGVRGSEYAWVNSLRLQQTIARLDIEYQHRLDLAPSNAVREVRRHGSTLRMARPSDDERSSGTISSPRTPPMC